MGKKTLQSYQETLDEQLRATVVANCFHLWNYLAFLKVPTHVGLIRIQNEISEVEKREIELRKEHETSRTSSVNDDSSEMSSSDSPEPISTPIVNIDSKDHFKKNKIIEPQPKPQYLPAPGLTRALSTPQLFLVSPVKNFNINAPHKGMMEKFIASRGKMIGNQHSPAQLNFKKNLMMVRKAFATHYA